MDVFDLHEYLSLLIPVIIVIHKTFHFAYSVEFSWSDYSLDAC